MLKQNSKAIGDLAELKVACDLIEQGYIVSKPLGDNSPYDMIMDMNGKLLRVQVKARTERNNKISVELKSSMRDYIHHYTDEDWDIIAVYNTCSGKIAYLNWDDIGDIQTLVLRTVPPKNNQKAGVKMFEDYSGVAQR